MSYSSKQLIKANEYCDIPKEAASDSSDDSLASKLIEKYPNADPKAAERIANLVHTIKTGEGVDIPQDWAAKQYPGLMMPSLARSYLNKSDVSKKQLEDLGFIPSVVAVPEIGQDRYTTYRHPITNLHLHDYGDRWLSHVDSHRALSVIPSRLKLVPGERDTKNILRNISRGAAHLWDEGFPGWIDYFNRVMMGKPGYASIIRAKHLADSSGEPVSEDFFKANMSKAIPRIGLLLGFSAALGSGYRLLLSKYKGEKLYSQIKDLDRHAVRATMTAIGAVQGLGTGAGLATSLAIMPYVSNALRKGKLPPRITKGLYLSTILGMTLGSGYLSKKLGRRLFLPKEKAEQVEESEEHLEDLDEYNGIPLGSEDLIKTPRAFSKAAHNKKIRYN